MRNQDVKQIIPSLSEFEGSEEMPEIVQKAISLVNKKINYSLQVNDIADEVELLLDIYLGSLKSQQGKPSTIFSKTQGKCCAADGTVYKRKDREYCYISRISECVYFTSSLH